MNENITQIEEQQEEKSIDFGHIYSVLKKHKRLYYKTLFVALVLGCVYALSKPHYYQCTVTLSPEMSSGSGSSLSALASTFGVDMGMSANRDRMSNALVPQLYPDLVNSVDFMTSLFPVKVRKDKGGKEMKYYDYLLNEQKAPWWSSAIKGFFSLFGSNKKPEKKSVDPFRLTKKQTAIAEAIRKRVVCDVDKKTYVITINVIDQDPLICATMADSVKERLQDFITEYKTQKARHDLAYIEKLYGESKQRYEKARRMYSTFSDANQDLILESYRSKQIDLENEMQLQFNNYN